jgi:3-hydroxyacyl-[acyl-carrier-protein] dehydratase
MKEAIKECLASVAAEENGVCAEFVFPESFLGFQGHFPGQPVLPGVCLVQVAEVAAEEMTGCALKLDAIINAKFFTSVAPDTKVQVRCNLADGIVKASVTAGDERISELKLGVTDA